jgi:hypothetical protein
MTVTQQAQALWNKVKSNPVFVAVSSAVVGALVSEIQDEMASGKVDWTRAGLNKLTGYAVTAGVAALIHLYRPNPNPQVLVTIPPSTKQIEVPAALVPENPNAVPVEPTGAPVAAAATFPNNPATKK